MAGAAFIAILITIAVFVTVSATAQPTKTDFVHLENRRKVVDISTDSFSPIFTEFSAAYQTAHTENQSNEARQELKEAMLSKFEDEKDIGEKRMRTMSGSIALKNPQVHKEFEAFKVAYEDAIMYTDEYARTSTAIVEAVSGSCGKVTKLEPSDEGYAENFVDASDTCLTKLADAKQNVSPSGKEMLTSLEKVFKERRDAFKKVVDESDEFQRNLMRVQALVSVLGINSELQSIQKKYESAATKEYDEVASSFNSASETLSKTLNELSGTSATEER